ncbi:MAG: HAMP domain-containing sensor histidine kinase [Oscillospiraceae bacterium]
MVLNDKEKENEIKVASEAEKKQETLENIAGIINNIDAINYQLREPVSSIFASLPILAENINSGDTEKASKNLQSLYGKTYIVLKNVNNISMAAKLSKGGEILSAPLDFSALVESAFSGASIVLPSYVKLEMEIEEGAVIKGNSSMLSCALFNLILNSIEYKVEEPVVIKVTLAIRNDRCVLCYSDNSLGIKPEVAPCIFKPYYSCTPYDDGEASTKLGLGLFIAKAAIENAGGNILLQSEFSQGVNYAISIPICLGEKENLVKSKPGDFVLNRYSELFVQLCEYCELPDLC